MKTPIPLEIFIIHIDLLSGHLPYHYQLDPSPELWHLFFSTQCGCQWWLMLCVLSQSWSHHWVHLAVFLLVSKITILYRLLSDIFLKVDALYILSSVPIFCELRANLILVITLRLQMSVLSFEILLWTNLSESWGERLYLIHTFIPNTYYRAGYKLYSQLVFWSKCFICSMYALFCSPCTYHFVLLSLNPRLVAYRFNLVCRKELLFTIRSLLF